MKSQGKTATSKSRETNEDRETQLTSTHLCGAKTMKLEIGGTLGNFDEFLEAQCELLWESENPKSQRVKRAAVLQGFYLQTPLNSYGK